MSSFSDCITHIINTWSGVYGSKQGLYDLWESLKVVDNEQIIRHKTQILDHINGFWMQTVKKFYNNSSVSLNFIAPNAMDAKAYFWRWSNDRNIEIDYVASLSTLLCYLMLYAKELSALSKDYLVFSEAEFPKDKIIDYFCAIAKISNKHNIQRIKTDCAYMAAVVFGTLCYCDLERKEQKERLNSYDSTPWICEKIDCLNKIHADTQVSVFQQTYFETLWAECRALNLRDIYESFGSFSSDNEIADLYVYPTFKCNKIPRESPVAGSQNFKRIIVANSGMGKTSLMQSIVLASVVEQLRSYDSGCVNYGAADMKLSSYLTLKAKLGFEKDYFPAFIHAVQYNTLPGAASLSDLASGSSIADFSNHMPGLLKAADAESRLLLLVDAIDEIEDQLKGGFGCLLDAFLREYPNVRLIMTSRRIDHRLFKDSSAFKDLEEWELEKFDQERIKELIDRWIGNEVSGGVKETKEQIYQAFINNRYMRRMAEHPYMFSHALYYRATHRGARPKDILSHIIDRLIEKRWPTQNYIKYNITVDYMRRVLSYIAWDMVCTGNDIVPAHQLADRFLEASHAVGPQDEAEKWLWPSLVKEMNARAGLLIPERDGYRFQMDLFKCYLAAEWLSSDWRNKQPETASLFTVMEMIQNSLPAEPLDGYWQEVILMFFSVIAQYNQRDNISKPLFHYLLYRASVSLCDKEITDIGGILADLVDTTFGANTVTNLNNNGYSAAQQQILRFICNDVIMRDERIENYIDKAKSAMSELSEKKLIIGKVDGHGY